MKQEYRTCRIADIAEKVAMGPFGSNIKVETFVPAGVPIISGAHLKGFFLEENDFNFITEEHAQRLKNSIVYPGDIIFTHAGNVGQAAMIPYNCHYPFYMISQRQFYLRCNKEKVLPEYLTYYFHSYEGQGKLLSNVSQVGVPSIAQPSSFLKTIEVPLPSLDVQRRIVNILDSFTKKIEVNNQINRNLEEQAKAIFKTWFVDFEPFGGNAPEGLKEVQLQDVTELVTKGTTPTTLGYSFTSQGINFIKAESITDWHGFDVSKFSHIDAQTNEALKRSIIHAGDILFSIAGTLGRFAIVNNSILPANTNQAVAIIRPNPSLVSSNYIYSFFLGGWHEEHYRKRIQQAVQANLSLTTIKSLPILLLPDCWKQQYEEIVHPIFWKISLNSIENRTLGVLRDTLLSKLVSGEILLSAEEGISNLVEHDPT